MFKKRYSSSTIRNYNFERRIFKRGIVAICFIFLLFIIVIIGRLIDLQIIDHKEYTTASNSNILALSPIPPKRGLIYDRNGHLLARGKTVYTLTLTPNKVANIAETIQKIKQYVTLSSHDLEYFYTALNQHRRSYPVVLKYNVTEKEADNIYAHHFQLPGVQIALGLKRIYPYANATCHVVGYVGRITADDKTVLKDNNYAASNFIGRTGVEKSFETELHGTTGLHQTEVDAAGTAIHERVIQPAIAGTNLHLSINIKLQQKIIALMGKRVGSVVVVNPSNGEILAMVSTPTFNPNNFVSGLTTKAFNTLENDPHFPLVNRAIHGDFSPGSTVKPFYSLYALNQKWLAATDTVLDPGWFKLPHSKHIFHDDLPGNYGWLNVTKAIILSSDTFFYNLANDLGIHRLDQALDYFHFGEKTGVQLPGEGHGLVPTPEWKKKIIGMHWFAGDTINAGIGQGYVLMTPLQLAMGTAMLAERGLHHQASILKLSQPQLNEITKTNNQYHVSEQQEKNWNTVINAMQGVILNPHGTGWRFGRNPPYSVAAKTGTVQVHGHCSAASFVNSGALPEALRCNQMFIAFAPVKEPKIALAVVIEHGGSASHIAREVMDAYFQVDENKKSQ